MPPILQGAAYYPDHWPEADWPADLDRIAAAGIRVIRFGEFSWSWFQPTPGRFTWGPYDRFVDLVAQRGLKLCLCTRTATLPPWLLHKYPDCRQMNQHGHYSLAARRNWCWNHRASRSRAATAILALARRYGAHPAVWGWQIDNEVHYEGRHGDVCDFNPAALEDFRQWLRGKYNDSLDALNAAWYTGFWSQRYGDWDHIGASYHLSHTNPHAWLDFARWRELNLAAMIRWQADLLRANTTNQSIGTNIPEVGVLHSAAIGQDYFEQARGLDWVGTDLYYATGNRAKDLRNAAYSCDLIRSTARVAKPEGAEFLLAEAQAGPHRRAWPMNFAGEAFGPDYSARPPKPSSPTAPPRCGGSSSDPPPAAAKSA